jgi:hypothetical protein
MLQEGESLTTALTRVGASSVVRSGAPGVWTTAYEAHDAYYFFVANTGDEPTRARVTLGEHLARELDGRSAADIVTGESCGIADGDLLGAEVMLLAKRVRAIKVVKEKGTEE